MAGPSFKVSPAYLKKEHTIKETSYERETSQEKGTTSTYKTTEDGKTTTVTHVKDGDRNFATTEQKTQKEAEQEAKKDDPQFAKSASYSKSWFDPKTDKNASALTLGERKKEDNDPNALSSWEGRSDVLYAEGDISSGISYDIDKKKAVLNAINASGKVAVLHGEAAGEFKLGKWVKGILNKWFGSNESNAQPAPPAMSAGLMAARVGDPTSHGSPLAPGIGSVNVFIGGKPAWRALMDFHACPVVKGVVPDVGGIVFKGSPTVFINNMMAVRLADQVIEAPGGPNPIIMGEPTVFIGDGGGGGGTQSQSKREDKSQDLTVGGEAKGDLLMAEASAQLGISGDLNKGEVSAQAKASAMAAVFKGSLSGSITIPIPFTEHALTLGGEVEGTALSAGAEAEASGGYSKEKGAYSKVGAKTALGLGVGVSFSLGFK